MTSTLPPFVQAVSGAFGSAVANASSYPLDLVCTRVQTSEKKEKQDLTAAHRTIKHISDSQGLSGLYTGIETDTAATLLSSFLYFYAYSYLRSLVVRRKASISSVPVNKLTTALSATEEIGVGFIAGMTSRAITTPLSLITVRLQSKSGNADDGQPPDPTVFQIVQRIYREDGFAGFWKGYEISALLCLNPSITLFFYQVFRRVFLRGKNKDLPTPRQAFFGAAFANVIAVSILYPLILAKTRQQASRKQGQNTKHSMLDVWKAAVSRDGCGGLYQGLEVQLLKGFFNQGLTMMTKQRLENLLTALYIYNLTRKRRTLIR